MNRFSFVVILFLLPLSSIYAKVVYVNQITGSDLNDGTSWGSAFKTLFYANGSLRTANGDSIWVAGAATYILTPATSNSLANSNSFYQNNKNWFGGFKGNETRINQRPLFDQDGNGVTESWEFQYPSIISVNLTDATGIVFGAGDFNGFTLTATATYSSRLNYVYALNAATRFANNIVKNCSVTLNMATTANETYNPFFRARGSVDNCLFEKNNVTVNTQNSYCYPFISIENSTTVTIGTKFTNNIVRNNKVRIDFSASSATSNSSIRGLILNVLPALQSNGLPTTVANCVIHNNDMTYVPSANNVSGSTLTNGAAISISTQNNTICTDSILNCTLVNNKGIRIKTAGIYIGFDAFSYHYILNNVFYNNQNSLDGTTFNIDNMSGSITSGVGSISNNFTNGGALNNTAGKIFNQDNTLSTNLPAFRVSTITIGATTDNSTELVDLSIGATSYLIGKGTTVNGRTLDKAGNSFQLPRSVGAYEFFQNCSIATNLATSGGTILSGDGNYNYGTLVSVVAKPGVGFHFVGWTENGNIVSTSTSYTFTVTGNRTLTASFMNNTIPLSSGTNTVSNFVNCDSCSFEVSGNGTSLEIDNNISMNSVTVNPGAKLTLNSGRTLNLESIFLRSDITGTATFVDKGTASIATANIQQYLTSGRNWYVSIPVSTTTSGSLSTASSIVYYNEPGATWNSVTAGSQLLPGRGYISVGTNANGVVNFSGSLNTGVVNVPLTRTHGVTKEGYNLVGNPYVSYLDWSKVDTAAANITPTIWYRTQNLSGSSYVFDTYNGLANIATTNGASAITNLIPPMQGFWVRVKNGFSSGNLSFNNGMRFHADVSNNQLKMPKNNDVIQSVLRLNISNGINSDETIVLFNSRASDSLDAFDSPKMMNNSASIPDLYSSVAGERLVINVLSAILDNMELPLGFSQNAAATFKFKATKMSNFPEGTHIYLRDKQENKEIELTPDTEYAFNTTAATLNNESRFSLLFKAPNSITGIINPENEQVSVFVSTQNELIILTKENTNYAIYNAVGQQIENGTLNSRLIIPNSKLNLGLYIVKVGNNSTKVIIK